MWKQVGIAINFLDLFCVKADCDLEIYNCYN